MRITLFHRGVNPLLHPSRVFEFWFKTSDNRKVVGEASRHGVAQRRRLRLDGISWFTLFLSFIQNTCDGLSVSNLRELCRGFSLIR